MLSPRQLGIPVKPMGPTAGIGDVISTAAAPAAAPAGPAPTAFDNFWNQYGATIYALSTIAFLLLSIPGKRGAQ